jgi:hypothetical protein
MVCCGSSSDFGKVLVPIPVSVPAPDPRQYLAQFSKNEKLHKILPIQCQKQLLSQKVGLLHLIF